MTLNALKSTDIEIETVFLIRNLAAAVPGDLGRMIGVIVGVGSGVNAYAPIKPPAGPIRSSCSLLELCCQIYRLPVQRAIPVGASLALLGIASSALDASQDGHRDLLIAYGAEREDSAIQVAPYRNGSAVITNASTAIIGLAWQALLEYGPRYGIEAPTLLEIGRLIAERLVSICEAQHRDLTDGRTVDISLEDYDEIILGKAGQIDGTASEVGALLANAWHSRDLWRTLGAERAVAQQLYDDYKDFSDDLLNARQISHPLLYALAVADRIQRQAILRLLLQARSSTPASTSAVEELTSMLQALGADYYTLTCMILHRNRALEALDTLQLPGEAHARLHDWIMRVAPAVV